MTAVSIEVSGREPRPLRHRLHADGERGEDYLLLTRRGHRLQALLDGTATPRDLNEGYFIRCVQEDADSHSHQCVEAEAWRQMLERRRFERRHPPPGAGRVLVRWWELRGGMILSQVDVGDVLVNCPHRVELRGRGFAVEYRVGPEFPWRSFAMTTHRHLTTDLQTGERREMVAHKKDVFTVRDDPDHLLSYIDRAGPDGDVRLHDADAAMPYLIPADRVSHDLTAAGPRYEFDLVRVAWWDGQPQWVRGPV